MSMQYVYFLKKISFEEATIKQSMIVNTRKKKEKTKEEKEENNL